MSRQQMNDDWGRLRVEATKARFRGMEIQNHVYSNGHCGMVAAVLISAFDWHKTEYGYGYWREVHDRLLATQEEYERKRAAESGP